MSNSELTFQQQQIIVMDTCSFKTIEDMLAELSITTHDFLEGATHIFQELGIVVYNSNAINKELAHLLTPEFQRQLEHLRSSHENWKTQTITENDPLLTVFQPLFTGNLDLFTGERHEEQADHTLIVAAVRLAQEHLNVPIRIYSNDMQVLQITKSLEQHLPADEKVQTDTISAAPVFTLTGLLASQEKGSTVEIDFTSLDEKVTEHYLEYRITKITPLGEQQAKMKALCSSLLASRLETLDFINRLADDAIQVYELEVKNRDLIEKNKTFIQRIRSFEKDLGEQQTIDQQKRELIQETIAKVHHNKDWQTQLTSRDIKKIPQTFVQLLTRIINQAQQVLDNPSEPNLQAYYRVWQQARSELSPVYVREVQTQLNPTLITQVKHEITTRIEHNHMDQAWVLHQLTIPLTSYLNWNEHEIELTAFNLTGTLLSLIVEDFTAFKDHIQLLESVKDNIQHSQMIHPFLTFSQLLLDQAPDRVSSKIIDRFWRYGKLLYESGNWTGAWYLLLPLWNYVEQSKRDQLQTILTHLYCTTQPPPILQARWEELNERKMLVSPVAVSRTISANLETDIKSKIRDQELHQYLKGKLWVVDTNIGRANCIIHLPTPVIRVGIQSQAPSVSQQLENALLVEFEPGCFKQNITKPKSTEQDALISLVLSLKKNETPTIIQKRQTVTGLIQW